ncbi:MAG: hypothetical protein ACI399_01420 [Candidatus Cryptobacteroides sp.]
MKHIKVILAIVCGLAILSCRKEEKDLSEPLLEVNYNNVSGTWTLEKVGEIPLMNGTFFEIELTRSEKTFSITTNLDSFTDCGHTVTGTYAITTSAAEGSVIEGMYDHDSGFWSHNYRIDRLSATTMVWSAVDDPEYVQTFSRKE